MSPRKRPRRSVPGAPQRYREEPRKPALKREDITKLKVAELRTMAEEFGVDTKLKKAELVDALIAASEAQVTTEKQYYIGGSGDAGGSDKKSAREGREGRDHRTDRNTRDKRDNRHKRDQHKQKHDYEPAELLEVSGILETMKEGYGFLRTKGYLASTGDAYIGTAMIRKNGLRRGDAIAGKMRAARSNEKFGALVEIESVNGMSPEEARGRAKFADLTPVFPEADWSPTGQGAGRLMMEHGKEYFTARTIDLVAPVGKGQRGLIVSPPKAGKTIILKDIAASIAANNPDVHLMCLLVDERPEEVTDMERSIRGEVISSTFDMPSENHIAAAELVIERAKRLVELGQDVVILLDSITRLARAYNLASPASGRILSGGVDSTALYPPKRFFGAARNIEHGGSLTILATALIDTGSKMDEVIFEEFKGTGNMELRLDRALADRRIFPAIDIIASGTRREDLLLEPEWENFIYGVRDILNPLDPDRAMQQLLAGFRQTEDNKELLRKMAKKLAQNGGDLGKM
ncbi:MAG: transcription termination factor Rho [Coriobacteriia bacterium]|nr:transcription termination factor Rho [Coriobacteriia bacterium]